MNDNNKLSSFCNNDNTNKQTNIQISMNYSSTAIRANKLVIILICFLKIIQKKKSMGESGRNFQLSALAKVTVVYY